MPSLYVVNSELTVASDKGKVFANPSFERISLKSIDMVTHGRGYLLSVLNCEKGTLVNNTRDVAAPDPFIA